MALVPRVLKTAARYRARKGLDPPLPRGPAPRFAAGANPALGYPAGPADRRPGDRRYPDSGPAATDPGTVPG